MKLFSAGKEDLACQAWILLNQMRGISWERERVKGKACSCETKQDCTHIEANLPCVPLEMPSTFHNSILQESVPIRRVLRQVLWSNLALAVRHLLLLASAACGTCGRQLGINNQLPHSESSCRGEWSSLCIGHQLGLFYFSLPQASGCFDALYLLGELQGCFPVLCRRALFVSLWFSH